jgi:hypothetical protein
MEMSTERKNGDKLFNALVDEDFQGSLAVTHRFGREIVEIVIYADKLDTDEIELLVKTVREHGATMKTSNNTFEIYPYAGEKP